MPSLMTNRLRFGLIRASTKGDWVRSLNWRRWSKLNKLLNFRSCSDWISNCFHQFCQKFNKILHKVFYKLRDGYCTAVTAMFYIYVVTCDSLNWNLINSNHDSQQVTILACKMFSLIKSLVEQLFGVSSPVLTYCVPQRCYLKGETVVMAAGFFVNRENWSIGSVGVEANRRQRGRILGCQRWPWLLFTPHQITSYNQHIKSHDIKCMKYFE